jgi:DNA end-binding protein Ku
MIDAKLKGEGIDLEAEEPETGDTNVIDLMAALKKSLGEPAAKEAAKPASKPKRAAAAQTTAKPSRKRA